MVKLHCGVYGEGRVFSVKIELSDDVEALQEAIAARYKVVSNRVEVYPATLMLYLVRKKEGENDKWLKDDKNVKSFLVGGIDEKYEEMRPSWKLDKGELFGPDFKPGEQEIQVLVELPKAAAGVVSGSQDMKELIELSVSKVLNEREEKQSVHSLSDLNSEQGERIMKKMRLREDFPDFDGTRRYFYCGIPVDLECRQARNIAHDESLLSIVDPRLPFRINGTADVLLVNRRAKNPLNKLAGIRLVIKLKKKVESAHFPQALGQLASCSLKAPLHCYPVSLLTDLNDHWHFSWFNEERVVAQATLNYPKNAIDFIVAAVSERESLVPFRVPFIAPPLNKLKVDDFLPMPRDGADEMMERYELMADVLEPEFLAERRMEYAQHLVQSMPMYAHIVVCQVQSAPMAAPSSSSSSSSAGALLAGGFLLFSSTVALFCLERKRHRQRVWRQRLTYKKLSKSSDLGASFGLDIGGTLGKIVYFERRDAVNNDTRKRPRSASLDVAAGEMNKFLRENQSFGSTGVQDVRLRIHSKTLNGVFHFVRFESNKTREAIEFIASNGINQSLRILPCTGGGAHKYGRAFNEMAGIELEKYDEIECTILGLHLLLTTLSDEVYTFEVVDFNSLAASRVKIIQTDVNEDVYPYLLVSIGSGVSVLYVKGPGDYERVSGSSIGGGTYWGLCRLMTHCESYDEALDLCVHGTNQTVDMSVGDIYGGAYDKFKLPASTVASSFGKMISTSRESVAFLNATLYKTKNIFFVGNFLRHNKISSRTLAYAINFWSNGAMEARFCKHEGNKRIAATIPDLGEVSELVQVSGIR
ncbi:hypothetical protein PF002_g8532 [Phytophthora fragariae]|uniref:Crinkler effector protein N-terminal domain-containing protein n=4 Tax=Phytophthora fragariae TaxID=53985 RepID=A0A6A3FZF4_9STRA|nr:hypothetical protein PF009_g713 [Phytophthora fragariae]KAE9242870.1 hypothetical protein PF002_g8532 [Phytophthora fragariae]